MIKPGQMAIKHIVLDEPALKNEVLPEGFYWQWPWNDMIAYDVTWQSKNESVEVLTADDLHVPTTVTVTYRPKAEELYRLHTEIGPTYYSDVISPVFVTLVRSEFAKHEHNNLARKSPEIEKEVVSKLRRALKGKPLEIDSVAIKHIRYEKRVTKSISEKLAKEQLVEQKKYELEIAKQDAEIARTQAQGRGDAIRIKAEGEARAIVIKGKAQAEAQEEITKTLTKHYLQYKAFDGNSTRYYFLPTGKDGLPIIINAGDERTINRLRR
jgi:regulator of protease activity HflC (stomatin/prohibitin superfamily)